MDVCYDGQVVKLEDDLPRNLFIECDSICLNQRSIDLEIQIPTRKVEEFDFIIINGVKFKKEVTK